MNRHLSDEELAMTMAGEELAPDRARHLEGCLSCRRELEELVRLIGARREDMEAGAPDWEAQRQRIVEQVTAPAAAVVPLRRRPVWRPLLAAAAAVVAVVGIWVQLARHRPTTTVQAVPVEQVLSEVDATLADESVPGFESLDSLLPRADELASMVHDSKTAS
ncbi:MAG TPA: hypothetical protein ENK19_05850 [Acidobacteria bacterium]|nr:hypothetical protein [Acidobacteriota bacterium]